MAESDLDEGLEHLEKFCGLLEETNAALVEDGAALEARGGALERLEEEARTTCDALGDRLQSAAAELDAALRDAVAASEQLGEAARELESERLAAVERRLDEEATELASREVAARGELETHLAGIDQAGFVPLAAALEAAGGTVAAADGEADEGFGGLRQLLADVTHGVAESSGAFVQAVAGAQEGLAAAQQTIEAASGVLTASCEELGSAVDERGAAVGEALQGLYEQWREGVVSDGEELIEGVAQLLQQGAGFVVDDLAPTLVQAVDGPLREALSALSDQLERLTQTLASGEQTSADASSTVDELVVARRVVAQVDELLDAMQVDA